MRWPVLGGLLLAAAILGAALALGAHALLPSAPADRAATQALVRDYILDNPEILPEAMQRLQSREAAAAVADNRDAIVTPYPGAEWGNPSGDVTLVAWLDFNCGYCRASLPAIAQLVESDPRVRIVYRELPILSPSSRTAAEWALAAANQGRFKPFHDALYAAGRTNDETIARAAAAAGLDMNRARADAASPAVAQELARNLDVAGRVGMTGTPAWVVGDRLLSGAQSFEQLRDAVAAARAAR